MTKAIGLSGGIGTGKSTVAAMWTDLGARLVDADRIVRELQAPGTPVLAAMVEAFGSEILTADGSLDRKGLGERIFSDPGARAQLGAIIGPAILREMAARLATEADAGADLVLLDIPLLFEGFGRGRAAPGEPPRSTGDLVSETVLVWAPEELQISRQMERDGATREHALARMAAQMPIDEKRALADHVIENAGDLEATRAQVVALDAALRARPAPDLGPRR
jgi:dephospho-CoA kinase